jgi:hypothetical protein
MDAPDVPLMRGGRKIRPRTCVVCFREFKRKKRGPKDPLLCCSRECGFVLMRRRGEQSRLVTQAKAEFARWARRAKRRAKRETSIRHCRCGSVVSKWCSYCPACAHHRRTKANRNSPSRRADKAYRKALSRGLVSGAERFDPLEVLARDGWRCHICGVSTPKRLRGTYDDRAPELDHIVPLAAGGQHTRLNTACACRRCNIRKSNQPLGQLRLVA